MAAEITSLPLARAPTDPAFDVLDDVLRQPGTHGVIQVVIPTRSVALAVARHAERRAASLGRKAYRASLSAASSMRDLARRMGLNAASSDAFELAEALLAAADAAEAMIIAPMEVASWDAQVARLISERSSRALFVLLSRSPLELASSSDFVVEERLDSASLGRFWDCVASVQSRETGGSLEQLDARVNVRTQGEPHLGRVERELLSALALSERPWPVDRAEALGPRPQWDALLAAGVVEVRDGLLELAHETSVDAPDPEISARVGAALATAFPEDPWALARSASLTVHQLDASGLEQRMRTALDAARDAFARSEMWKRWRELLPQVQAAPSDVLRVAELALELGDVEVALDFARPGARSTNAFRHELLLGRAFLARGDLVSAEAALLKAMKSAPSSEQAARAAVELAETAYARGEFNEASRLASQALDSDLPELRLGARNVLGKILLARAAWDEADQHFAADVCEAISSGASVSELRARVNRAIALLSRGSRDEAQALLESVLADGEARREPRAVAFALSNLAVLAIERHEHAKGLQLLEETTSVHRRLGDRLGFARDVANLVELRLRLGLVEHAEQGLRFGRQALGAGAPLSRMTELSLATARVHLARGRTLDAERELAAAHRAAAHASDGDKIGECQRLEARVALEDGRVPVAQRATDAADAVAASPFDHAEVALLRALIARAAGQPAEELAEQAVAEARKSGDEELCREAHVTFAEVALAAGDDYTAAHHVRQAARLRDQLAEALPGSLRDAYLARPDMVRLSRLERLDVPADEPRPASAPARAGAKAKAAYVGRDPGVRSLLAAAERVAPTDATVLVLGESGTGKELIAELIHGASRRSDGPLVKVNCAALVESLLLSELFGHEKGSFTGATSRKRGRFERANGGTLFLDEIGDISPRTQVALLRVLEERRIERVGGTASIPVDVRIVCATNRNLKAMVEAGQFREDLYYRLAGLTLDIPALRERLTDLPMLMDALLNRIARERGEVAKTLSTEAVQLCMRYRWPGNVRELDNAMRAASLFAADETIRVTDLVEHVEALRRVASEPQATSPDSVRRSSVPPAPEMSSDLGTGQDPVSSVVYREIRHGGTSLSDLKRNIEKECITRALAETGGNITRAAALLGMKRPRLSQLVKQYELSTEEAS
ncbi:MAG: sigma 54-interacting transcriptional regulator [Polyangiaceae bacterium]